MILHAEQLSLSFPSKGRTVFSGVSLDLDRGGLVLVTGRSGAGKTLLGLTLTGYLPLWASGWKLEGAIECTGKRLTQGEYRADIGLVLENPMTQISGLKRTVEEELAFPLESRGAERKSMEESIDRYTRKLGINRLLKRTLLTLSGGELQRVVIACVLITCPRFLFLDRFLMEIDSDFRPRLLELLFEELDMNDGAALAAEDPLFMPAGSTAAAVRLGDEEEDMCLEKQEFFHSQFRGMATPEENVLEVDSLSFSYRNEPVLFNDVSFSLAAGELVFLAGPNGSGKTTLAKLISGLLTPASGDILICGCSRKTMGMEEIIAQVGFAPQNPSFNLCRRTVREEFELAERWGYPPGELPLILGLAEHFDSHPLDLSSAEKKRLGTALACSGKKSIVILDEPSQYQDADGFMKVANTLKHVLGEGKGVLVITHDPRLFRLIPDARIIHLSREDSG